MKSDVAWFIYAVMDFVKTGQGAAAFTLVHISDFHLCRPSGAPPAGFFNKRILSYLSWRVGRRRLHDPAILDALVRAVKAQAADHVVVTGDLTQLSLPEEFDAARQVVEAIGSSRDVFVVPGNHDALVTRGWEERLTRWADYMAADGPDPSGQRAAPALRVRGPAALIGLSSAHPTRPFSAVGSVGAGQLARCAALLAEASQRSLYRVLLIHHPPVPGSPAARKRLLDAGDLGRVLERYGAELILHGHVHRRSRTKLPGNGAPIPVLGAPSASATGADPLHRAGFGVVRVRRTPNGWSATFQDHWYVQDRRRFIAGEPEAIESFHHI